jgi:hypothetical protein
MPAKRETVIKEDTPRSRAMERNFASLHHDEVIVFS